MRADGREAHGIARDRSADSPGAKHRVTREPQRMHPRRGVFWAVLILGILGTAEPLLAWGPATHIALGGAVLSQLALLPAAIAALLARHAAAYLYGNIAADIVFAKRWSRVKQFCHHWSTGFGVLRAATDDRTRAFAYGYLSHLAADTVAHGKYVPRLVQFSGVTLNGGHLYWELRADALRETATWNVLKSLFDADHDAEHAVLANHLYGTLLSYEVNRFLFDRLNLLSVSRGFRRSMSMVGRCSRWSLPTSMLSTYDAEGLERMLSILSEGEQSAVVREDPNGTAALHRVRDLRRARRRGRGIRRRAAVESQALTPVP